MLPSPQVIIDESCKQVFSKKLQFGTVWDFPSQVVVHLHPKTYRLFSEQQYAKMRIKIKEALETKIANNNNPLPLLLNLLLPASLKILVRKLFNPKLTMEIPSEGFQIAFRKHEDVEEGKFAVYVDFARTSPKLSGNLTLPRNK